MPIVSHLAQVGRDELSLRDGNPCQGQSESSTITSYRKLSSSVQTTVEDELDLLGGEEVKTGLSSKCVTSIDTGITTLLGPL